MSFKDSLKKNLAPELYNQVVDSLGDDFDYDVVPRSRLNKVIGQRNDLKAQLAQKVSTAAADEDDLDDDDSNNEPGKSKGSQPDMSKYVSIKDHNKALDDLKNSHKAEMESMRKSSAAIDKLRSKGAIDPEIILKSGLINLESMNFGDDGTLGGLDEAVKQLVKDKAYLFGSGDHQRGTGRGGDSGDDGEHSALDTQLSQIFGMYTPQQTSE